MSDRIADAIAEHIIARLKEAGLVVAAPAAVPETAPAAAPTKAAAKPAAKADPKPAAKPAGKAAAAPTPARDAVHEALRTYMQANGKDAALAILHKYAPTINELKEEDFPKVLAELAGEPAPVPAAAVDDDDPFA